MSDERRYADDGGLYTRAEFMEYYGGGGKLKWEQATKPKPKCHEKKRNWKKERGDAWSALIAPTIADEVDRLDLRHLAEPDTVEAYEGMRDDLMELAQTLGRTCGKQAGAWRNMFNGLEVLDAWAKATGEKRRAEDGVYYARLGFLEYYPDDWQAKWDAAEPQAAPTRSGRAGSVPA
eukprot:TRINITY_DN21119_c0_g1_i1.p1 TRINITY_DN21119_c0_g1~~TRINITY_DN21119_c0_g1_i1.p1  ORF type:complete len:177 (+),score=53.81 TRINITY_DN21119_c0_g1_i1:62-592(+)